MNFAFFDLIPPSPWPFTIEIVYVCKDTELTLGNFGIEP